MNASKVDARRLITAAALACAAFAAPAAPPYVTERIPVAAPTAYRPAHRVYGDWTLARLDGGGYIQGVAFSPDPDRLYAWTDVGGAHRSDDGGRTWRNITSTLPYGRDGSADRGQLYVRGLLTDLRPDDPDAGHPDRCLIAVGYAWSPRHGLYLTEDAGASWQRVLEAWSSGDSPARADGDVLLRDPHDPETLWFAALKDGVFRSEDNGATWRHRGGPEVLPADLAADAAQRGRLLLSSPGFDHGVAADRANAPNGRLVLPAGLWHTENAGDTWAPLLPGRVAHDLLQDPQDAAVWYGIFDRHAAVERSVDGGRTWQPFADGLDTSPRPGRLPNPQRYLGLAHDDDHVYALASRGSVYRLHRDPDRNAERWRRVGPRRLRVPADWFGATPDAPHPGSDWFDTFAATARLTINPRNPQEMFVTDWYSVHRSIDGGGTWTHQTDGIGVTYVDALEADPADPSVVHAGLADVGYFRSADGGRSFVGLSRRSAITNNVKSVSVSAADPDRVYALGPNPPGGGWYAGHVFVSEDRGETWRASAMTGLPTMGLNEGDARAFTVLADDTDARTVYVTVAHATRGGVYVSRDGGDTWNDFSAGLPGGPPYYREHPWGSGKEITRGPDGVLLTHSIERRLLHRRRPGDAAWTALPFPARDRVNDLRADPHRPGRFFAAATGDGLYRTDDHGDTWTRLDLPAPAHAAVQLTPDRRRPGRWAVGTHAGVVFSTDGGDTWSRLDPRLPGRVGWNKAAFAGDRLVVGSGGLGLYWIDLAHRERPAAPTEPPDP